MIHSTNSAPVSPANSQACDLPIGLFDSGVGGLTVLKALHQRMPAENLLYLGDTARLPYGTKSASTVTHYALQASAQLVARNIKMLVVACNTVSAVALSALRNAYPHIPVLGVVEPGAEACCAASKSGNIAIIATESTIQGHAYERAIHALRPEARITPKACSLFVPLAEEGWLHGELVEGIAARYLHPIFRPASGAGTPDTPNAPDTPDCLMLGCTHFPLLAEAIRNVIGERVTIVDSAATAARAVDKILTEKQLNRAQGQESHIRYLATDDLPRFVRTGSLFLGTPIAPDDVELIDL